MILFTSYADKFKKLTDEQLGRLWRMIFAYQREEEVPDFGDPVLDIAFDVIKSDLDANNEAGEPVRFAKYSKAGE